MIQGGREFLAAFSNAPQRITVALLMADAYSRKNDTANEFAIYDAALKELATQAQNVPLGLAAEEMKPPYRYRSITTNAAETEIDAQERGQTDAGELEENSSAPRVSQAVEPPDTSTPRPSTGTTTISRMRSD